MLLGCALNNWNHVCSHLLNLELAWMMFVSHLLLRSACQGITTSWLHLDSTWWCNVCAAWLPTHICGWECHAAHGCGCLGAPHGAAGFVPVAQRRFAVWRWQTLSFADSATGFLIAIHSYICFGLFWHLLLFHVAHCMFSVLIWLEKIVLMIVQAGAGPKKGAYWTIEQPSSSLLPFYGPFKELAAYVMSCDCVAQCHLAVWLGLQLALKATACGRSSCAGMVLNWCVCRLVHLVLTPCNLAACNSSDFILLSPYIMRERNIYIYIYIPLIIPFRNQLFTKRQKETYNFQKMTLTMFKSRAVNVCVLPWFQGNEPCLSRQHPGSSPLAKWCWRLSGGCCSHSCFFFAQSKLQPTLQWQHFWSSLTVLLQGRAWENQEIQGHQNGAPLQGQSKQAKSCGSLRIQNLTHYILFSESNWRFTVSWSCCRICWISIIFLVVYFFLTIFGP